MKGTSLMIEHTPTNPYGLCNFEPTSNCATCPVNGQVFCHFERPHVLRFFIIILPVFAINAAGLIRQRQWRQLALWIGGLFFFLQVPENLILCSHCPYYAQGERRTLLCHANAGLLKLWPFNPAPMSRVEQTIFLVGALAALGYPAVINLNNGERAASAGGLLALGGWFWAMRRFVCKECPNFSCPLNTVPASIQQVYLRRNPAYAQAWGLNGQSAQKNEPASPGD